MTCASAERYVWRGDAGVAALRAVADAYLGFAVGRRALYAPVMAPPRYPAGHVAAHDALWAFVSGVAADAFGAARAPAAAVSVWVYPHGVVGLEHAGLFGEHVPRAPTRKGLAALLQGLAELD